MADAPPLNHPALVSKQHQFKVLRESYAEAEKTLGEAQRKFNLAKSLLEDAMAQCHHLDVSEYAYEPYNEPTRDPMSGYTDMRSTGLYQRYKVTTCQICGRVKKEKA